MAVIEKELKQSQAEIFNRIRNKMQSAMKEKGYSYEDVLKIVEAKEDDR